MTLQIQLKRSISVALASTNRYGDGANLEVVATFALPHSLNLKDLQTAFNSEADRWDHRHLGLDIEAPPMTAVGLLEQLKRDLKNLQVKEVNLVYASGRRYG